MILIKVTLLSKNAESSIQSWKCTVNVETHMEGTAKAVAMTRVLQALKFPDEWNIEDCIVMPNG